MKKFLLAIIMLGAVSFTACKSSNSKVENDTAAKQQQDSLEKSVLDKANQLYDSTSTDSTHPSSIPNDTAQ